MSETKRCLDCDELKPVTDFNRDKPRKDGLTPYCRPCIKVRKAAHYAKNAERIKAKNRQWRKDNPERYLANGAAWRAANKEYMRECGARWYEQNKERAAELGRKNYQANKERHLEYSKLWHATNRAASRVIKQRWKQANPDVVRLHAENRRARLKDLPTVPFTAAQLSARWDYYGRKCWLCGTAADSTDHVKPVAKGGAHMLCNLRPICRPCNSAKRDRWPFAAAVAA